MINRNATMRQPDVRPRVVEQARPPRRDNLIVDVPAASAVAGYIADMTAQLESMATAAGLDLLAYFLAMARAESESASRAANAVGEDVRSG